MSCFKGVDRVVHPYNVVNIKVVGADDSVCPLQIWHITYRLDHKKKYVQITTAAIMEARWDISAAPNVCLPFLIPTAPKYTAIV